MGGGGEILEEEVKKLVVKSNVLVESKYKLTNREQKIILFLLSQIKKKDEEFKTYTLPIKKFSELIGLKGNPKYDEMRKITKDLMSKVLEIRIGKKIHQVSWLSYVVYNEDEGAVDLRFDPFLKPYLLQLKKEFTSYQLQNVITLKGSYSIRLYELLKQYEALKERVFEVKELKELLGVEKMYPAYGNFKQRILLPSQEELGEKTDIYFNFEEIKYRRSVKRIKFSIHKQGLKMNNVDERITSLNEELIQRDFPLYERINEMVAKYGYSVDYKTVQRWESLAKERWKSSYFNKLLGLIDEVNHNDEVENPVGFITYILRLKERDSTENPLKNNTYLILKEVKGLFKETRELLPAFIVEKKVIEFLVEEHDFIEKEAKNFLDNHNEMIMSSLERYAKQNIRKKK